LEKYRSDAAAVWRAVGADQSDRDEPETVRTLAVDGTQLQVIRQSKRARDAAKGALHQRDP